MSERRNNNQPGPGGPGRGPGGPGRGMVFEKPKNAKGTLTRLLGFLRGNLGLIVLVMVMSVITAGISIASTRIYGVVIDDYIGVGDLAGLIRIGAALLVLYLVNVFVVYIQNTKMVDVAQYTSLRLRKALFESMQGLPLKFFDTHSSGDLMSRLTNDVDTISNTLSMNVTSSLAAL